MAQVEEQIIAEGVQIIWVLQEDSSFKPGTAGACRTFMASQMSNAGLCVGDGETQPNARVFDMSSFAIGRGFDVLVRRSDMQIIYTTTHGTPSGNDNVSGEQLLDEIKRR